MRLALVDICSSQAGSAVHSCVRGMHRQLWWEHLFRDQCTNHTLSPTFLMPQPLQWFEAVCHFTLEQHMLTNPMRLCISRSPHCDFKIFRCVKLLLVSPAQGILNSAQKQNLISEWYWVPAKPSAFLLPQPGVLESTRSEETGNLTQISCFLNEF